MHRLSIRKRLMFAAATCLTALVLLELAARAFSVLTGIGRPAPRYPFDFDPRLGWRITTEFDAVSPGEGIHKTFHQGLQATDLPDALDQDSTRPVVLVIGDSNAYGVGVRQSETFAERLKPLLPSHRVVNLGVPGHSSFQGLQSARAALPRFRPTHVIYTFNFNDRRYVLAPAEADSLARFKSYERKSRVYLALSRSRLLIFVLWRMLHGTPAAPPANVLDLDARVPPAAYRANLEAMIELTRAQHAQPILLLLHDNPLYTREVNAAMHLLENDHTTSGAARALELGRVARNGHERFQTLAQKGSALALQQLGKDTSATLEAAITQPLVAHDGGNPIYPDYQYNALMRQVAEERRAPLLDGAARVDALGPEAYTDFCHFNAAAHADLAVALAALIARNNPGQPQ